MNQELVGLANRRQQAIGLPCVERFLACPQVPTREKGRKKLGCEQSCLNDRLASPEHPAKLVVDRPPPQAQLEGWTLFRSHSGALALKTEDFC